MSMEEKIEAILDDIGLSYKFYQFDEEEGVPPPFIVYTTPSTSNFNADDRVYLKQQNITIEYYFDKKDFSIEKQIEDTFDKHDICWERTDEIYIDSEKMFVIYYDFQL